MGNWITGRKPSAAEANANEEVLAAEGGLVYYGIVSPHWHWMPSPPMVVTPKPPRTLKDAFGEYVSAVANESPTRHALFDEMVSIVEAEDG